jgi:serine/threonine protein kinase
VNKKTGEITMIDFGQSHMVTHNPITRIVGSEDYMPPEYFFGGYCMWKPKTVWSLGSLLYVLTHGDWPFVAEHDSIVGDIPMREDISPQLKHYMKGMLNKSPVKRMNLDILQDHPWITQSDQ